MGQNCSTCECSNEECYLIETKTGDIKGMGSLSTIFITLVNTFNECSDCTALSGFFLTAFRKGNWDRFKIKTNFTFVPIKKIIIGRKDDDVSEAWYLEKIRICRYPNDTESNSNEWKIFPVHRWIKCNQFISVSEEDCTLPQDDENRDQRICELAYKQSCYRFNHVKNLPPQCLEIPLDEIHSNYQKWDIMQRKITIFHQYDLHEIGLNEVWNTEDERLSIFAPEGPLKKPNFLHTYLDDTLFIHQRLAGCYPHAIRLCKSLPDDIKITPNVIEPFLEGFSLQEAMEKNHLFYVDLKILRGICNICTGREMHAPFALFYIDRLRKNMKVIAIQLTRNESNNEIFLPSCPKPLWLSAKMWFNNAEAIVHKSSILVGNSHMLMESIATAVHRQLSPSHPVFRLLIFAMKDVIPINNFEIVPLTKHEGFLHKTTNVGSDGCIKLVERSWKEWRMDVDGWLPTDLETRGVLKTDVIPYYPYRDDALLLFDAFDLYVKDILGIYYDSPNKLEEDYEVQNWGKELVSESGADIKGVFGDGNFTNLADLQKTCTSILFLSFVQHLAVSLPQYDNYCGFNIYSTLMLGELPSLKIDPSNWPNQLSGLPTKRKCMEMLAINMVLSERESNGFGDFNCTYLYNQSAIEAKKRLTSQLRHISKIIDEQNTQRIIIYNYLNPIAKNR